MRGSAAAAEDTLWSKYGRLREALLAGADALADRPALRYDDSGRLVDMTEVADALFIGSECVSYERTKHGN